MVIIFMFETLCIAILTPKTENSGFHGQLQCPNCVNEWQSIAGKDYLWSAKVPLVIKG